MTLSQQYQGRYEDVLISTADRLRDHIEELLSGMERIDSVSSRAKTPDRFLIKAEKFDDDGNVKYNDPINQIQDQIGARITVFYLSDVDKIRAYIEKYFSYIESQAKFPERHAEFGYFGAHMILKLPEDVIDDDRRSDSPEFFELQIKTLFQHAWSEAHHDLGYKSPRELTPLEKRQVAFSAAQAWGADQIFEQLSKSVLSGSSNHAPKKDLE